jgi:hypothetical protein
MKQILLFATAMMAFAITAHATVWRVNNLPGTDAHFTTLQAAHDAAYVLPGDTLYLEASSGTYGNLTATKRLVIIGAGYFNAENPDTQANVAGSVTGIITFNAGSGGSIVSGCTVDRITINISNLLIEKCRFAASIGNNTSAILLSGNSSNIIIRQNFFEPDYISSSGYLIRSTGTANNVSISNNYFKTTSTTRRILQLTSGFAGEISNNIFDSGTVEISNAIYQNNIMTNSTFTAFNTSILNNLGNSTQFGTENGNQSNVNMADVFVGVGSTDGKWQLKEGSPAIGAGVNGEDCGMFGGSRPYVLSGIPAIPSIYRLVLDVDNVLQHVGVDMDTKTNE